MIGAETVGPGFADSIREIWVVMECGFNRNLGRVGLKSLL
jgi:hypothetical protein